MENKIDISVIIPMFNVEKYIEHAIQSIVMQQSHGLTYEIIIVDDLSIDNSREVVKNFKNENIRLIELDQNGGTANARNVGIRAARGEWIQFMDSDDAICSDLYTKFEKSKKSDANVYVFSLIIEFHDYTLKQSITEVKDKRAFGHFGGIWNKFIRKDLCLDFGEVSRQNEDNVFIIDMMIAHDLKIALIPDAYYLYNRKNDNSKMANFNKKEFRNMFFYVYRKIPKCDAFTKMYILEMFVATLFDKERPFWMSVLIATKTLFRLLVYLPQTYLNQNRHFVKNTIITP